MRLAAYFAETASGGHCTCYAHCGEGFYIGMGQPKTHAEQARVVSALHYRSGRP